MARLQSERAASVLMMRQAILSLPSMAIDPEDTKAAQKQFAAYMKTLLGE